MAKKKNIPPKKTANKQRKAKPKKAIKVITTKKKPKAKKPSKPKKKLGRPKKRGRKKLYRKPIKKQSNRKRSNTNKQYWKVYYRLLRRFNDKREASEKDGKPFIMPSAGQLRKYTTKLYSEFKKDAEKSGKKFNISAKTLDDILTKEKLDSFIRGLGVGLPIEPFPFWYLEAELDKIPPDTIIEISTDNILGENGGETIREINTKISPLDIINNINNFINENIDKYPDKYLWFIVEITDDGYYIELIFDANLDAGFKGQRADKLPPKEKPPVEEPPAPAPAPAPAPDKPEEPSPEKKRKEKAEADTAEIEKIRAAQKVWFDQLREYKELALLDEMKEPLIEIKKLNEKLKKLTE